MKIVEKIVVVSPLEVLLADEKLLIEKRCGKDQKIQLKNGRFSGVDEFVRFIREHPESFVCLVVRGNVNKWYRESESELEHIPDLMFGVLRYVDLSIGFKRIFCGAEKGEPCHKESEALLWSASESIFPNEDWKEEKDVDIHSDNFVWKSPGLDYAPFN